MVATIRERLHAETRTETPLDNGLKNWANILPDMPDDIALGGTFTMPDDIILALDDIALDVGLSYRDYDMLRGFTYDSDACMYD